MIQLICGAILVPFLGTALGSAGAFGMRRPLGDGLKRALSGFAAGVMAAASVWSLILPALEQSAGLGRLSFLPAAAGFWAGVLFLRLLDGASARLRGDGPGGAGKLTLAVTLHNVPEGMAVGAAAAGFLRGGAGVTAAGLLALSAGIAIQNIPEGAIISLPLRAQGMGRGRAFVLGALSGAVEPLGAVLTLALSAQVVPLLPFALSFAAGAMMGVVVEELIPDARSCALPFALGFTLMMALDVALG